MRRQPIVLVTLLWMAFAPLALARPVEIEVQPGDALITLSRRYDVSLDDLRAWNHLTGDRIEAGKRLRLAPEGESTEGASGDLQVEITPGDTLSGLAQRHGYTVADLLEWNPGLDPDRIFAGQKIWLGDARRLEEHEVRPGQTLTAIAHYHRVEVEEILRWNPGLSPNRIRAGQSLQLISRRPKSPSLSLGLPYQGRLKNAALLPGHPLYKVRDRERAFGTDETVRNLRSAFDHLHSKDPRAPRVEVHDLSVKDGGRIEDHASHQSGRDADIAYMARRCGKRVCDFRNIGPGQLDAARQWDLLSYWLVREQVEAIFVDYALQAPLYREAKRRGATPDQLSLWFQYPRGPSHPGGTVRHQAKHRDHLHVRFACHRSDPDCQVVRVVAERARLQRAAR